MFEGLRNVVAADPRVAYALLFGSAARGSAHRSSDLDIAVGLRDGVSLSVLEIGALITRLEGAAGHPVLPKDLAIRRASASAFRNLVAHQYGVLDWTRVHTMATERLDDLLAFCDELTRRAQ